MSIIFTRVGLQTIARMLRRCVKLRRLFVRCSNLLFIFYVLYMSWVASTGKLRIFISLFLLWQFKKKKKKKKTHTHREKTQYASNVLLWFISFIKFHDILSIGCCLRP